MSQALSSELLWLDCQALLFDLDGTLVDSSGSVVRAWQWWAARHNADLSAILKISSGRPSSDVIREIAPHLDHAAEARGILTREEEDREGLVLIPGADRILAAAQAGRWTVVTSCPRNLARIRLEAVGLPVPSGIVTADQIKRGKPDPEAFLLAAERLVVDPKDCIVFEDAPAGIEGAQAAGMRVVAVEFRPLGISLPATTATISDYRGVQIGALNGGWRLGIPTP
jgi:mannitol-1-/sugar-/sorbitol-6-phosphatase